jgi:hypothetical protein
MRRTAAVLFTLLGCLGGATAAAAPFSAMILAHHAFYKLTLKSSMDQGVLAASGNMTYDINDGCTGWTTSQHLLIHMTDRDGRNVTMVSDYATFETKDGTHLNFHTRQMTDSATTASLDGNAVLDRSGGRGYADFTTPNSHRVHRSDYQGGARR